MMFFFPRTAPLASLLTETLLVFIVLHVALGAFFAVRRTSPPHQSPLTQPASRDLPDTRAGAPRPRASGRTGR